MGNVLRCHRGKVRARKYASHELHVPEQCATLWQALQRTFASRGKIKTIVIAPGDYTMGDEAIVIDSSMIHIRGAGKGKTRLFRNDNVAKLQVCGGARNVFVEGLTVMGGGSGDGIVVIGGSSLRLEKVEVNGVGGFGVHVSGKSDCEVVGSFVWNCNCPGVWCEGKGSNVILRDSDICHNTAEGAWAANEATMTVRGANKLHHNSECGLGAEDGGVVTVEGAGLELFDNNGGEDCVQRKELSGGRIIDAA